MALPWWIRGKWAENSVRNPEGERRANGIHSKPRCIDTIASGATMPISCLAAGIAPARGPVFLRSQSDGLALGHGRASAVAAPLERPDRDHTDERWDHEPELPGPGRDGAVRGE